MRSITILKAIAAFTLIFPSCTTNSNHTGQTSWYKTLPPCPCQNPDLNGIKKDDGWAADGGDINTYHQGASACFRSYPPVKTSEGKSGQQCCYDSEGNLITGGAGAGTPDKVSVCAGESESGALKVRYVGVLMHWWKDVKPWKKFGGTNDGWKKYNQLWPPDNGNGCSSNIIPK